MTIRCKPPSTRRRQKPQQVSDTERCWQEMEDAIDWSDRQLERYLDGVRRNRVSDDG